MDKKIIGAIVDNKIMEIIYNDGDVSTKRRIEPISYGVNRYGNKVIRAWQPEGESKSYDNGNHKKNDDLTKIAGYRMFRTDRITNYRVTNDVFRTDKNFLSSKRPKLNILKGSDDKDMVKVYASIEVEDRMGIKKLFNLAKSKLSFGKNKYKLSKVEFDDLEKEEPMVKRSNFNKFATKESKKNIIIDFFKKIINK